MSTMVSKLSIATMGATDYAKRNVPKAGEQPFPIATIYGKATKLKTVEDKQTGVDHIALIGQFEGIARETGEVFTSGVCYLPPGMHDSAVALLQANPGEEVQFSIDIAVVHASNAAGRSYVGKVLVAADKADPLSELRSATQQALPKPEPKTIDGTATEVKAGKAA